MGGRPRVAALMARTVGVESLDHLPPSASPVAAQYDRCIIAVSVSESPVSDQEQPYMGVRALFPSPMLFHLLVRFGSDFGLCVFICVFCACWT